MAKLTFYFDPLCPWAWRTSLWIREARMVRDLQITWRVFSLRENNRDKDPQAADPVQIDDALRVSLAARQHGGDDAVDRFYLATGRARHERHQDLRSGEVLEAALLEAGLPVSLYAQAVGDPATIDAVLAEHAEAVERYAAFGVPWLVVGDQQIGFYGPIITDIPPAEVAGQLWDHTEWLYTQPYFYEIKRERH